MSNKAEIKKPDQSAAIFDVHGLTCPTSSGIKAVGIASGIFIIGDKVIQLNFNTANMYVENTDKQCSDYLKYNSNQFSLPDKIRKKNNRGDKELIYDLYKAKNVKKENSKKDRLFSGKRSGLTVEYYHPEEAFIYGWMYR